MTRRKEIRQRRTRRAKSRKERLRALQQALQKGRTHADRTRIAQEFREKSAIR